MNSLHLRKLNYNKIKIRDHFFAETLIEKCQSAINFRFPAALLRIFPHQNAGIPKTQLVILQSYKNEESCAELLLTLETVKPTQLS